MAKGKKLSLNVFTSVLSDSQNEKRIGLLNEIGNRVIEADTRSDSQLIPILFANVKNLDKLTFLSFPFAPLSQ